MKLAIGLPVTIVLTCLLWAFVYSTFPIFVAVEALAKSRELGVLTPELEVIIHAEDVKSALVVYMAWGVLVGLIGAFANGGKGLGVRLVTGVIVGAALGALTNYISDQYALRSTPPRDAIQYWILRYSLVQLPLSAAVAISASVTNWRLLPENLVKTILAAIFTACLYSFLMGLVTPLEQVQFLYPRFPGNSFILLFSFNILCYFSVIIGKRASPAAAPTEASVDAERASEPH